MFQHLPLDYFRRERALGLPDALCGLKCSQTGSQTGKASVLFNFLTLEETACVSI